MTTCNNNTPSITTAAGELPRSWSVTNPIRYDALGNPGLWYVRAEFRDSPDIGVDHPSLQEFFELAAYSEPYENKAWRDISDGIWVEIRRQPNCRLFVLDAYVSAPTRMRHYKGIRQEFAKMADALRAGDRFILESRDWLLDKTRSVASFPYVQQ